MEDKGGENMPGRKKEVTDGIIRNKMFISASNFTDPGKLQETFSPRHIKTIKVGSPQLKSPISAWRLEREPLKYTRTRHRESPGACDPPKDSGVEVSPSRCASGENRTSPSATPQQIAYTSGGEAGRREKPAPRGRRKGEEPKLRTATGGKGEEKKMRERAQPPQSSLPGFSRSSFPLSKAATTSRGQDGSFARKPGTAGACAALPAASHLRREVGRGRRRHRLLRAREAAGGLGGGRQGRGGRRRAGDPLRFYLTSGDCLLSWFAISRGDRPGPRGPGCPGWRRRNLRALRAAPTPPPPGPTRAAAASRLRGGTRDRALLPGPESHCRSPPASVGQPPELPGTLSLPSSPVQATAGPLPDSFPLTPREETEGTSPTCNNVK
ncbi:serine/arginine repetitive matrix protein 1-like isoform X1 [Homo sapiens]|uniref:serine/arginine repetitive matrix protein 1-like isoform X1 n=1 Tax=Homo sapiens TaxID=9606 RepID=UPI0003EAF1C9|nr:serine/arginine repetitive matrix protein 1-like isoform X1 [Homo sapiens]